MKSGRPLAVELYCGSLGWSRGWLARGGRAIGVDIEHMPWHGPVPDRAELILQDVRTLHGAQFADADLILASPPCQEFSYRAMPWKRAKALPPPYLGIDLFWQCWRIQHEASEAAGRYIPLVVENVKGAQPWVGRARWHFGSYYLWGDVPTIMPIVGSRGAVKAPGLNWSKYGQPGYGGEDFTRVAGRAQKNNGGSWFALAHNTESGHGQNPDGRKTSGAVNRRDGYSHTRHLTNQAESDAVKQHGSGADWWDKALDERRKDAGRAAREMATKCGGDWFSSADGMSLQRRKSSHSNARRAASAAIAVIPRPLSDWIAEVYWQQAGEERKAPNT